MFKECASFSGSGISHPAETDGGRRRGRARIPSEPGDLKEPAEERGEESCCWIRFLSERPEQDPVCSTMSARRDQVSLDPPSDGVVELD